MDICLVPQPSVLHKKERTLYLTAGLISQLNDPLVSDRPAGIHFLKNRMKRGAYSLEIDDGGITIGSSSQSGTFSALQTLAQLVTRYNDRIPCCYIEDAPLFDNRAVMLDISRGRIYKMDYLKGMIRRFALLKFNQLQLYMEHSFAYEGHEVVWRGSSPYTADEIREIDSFCSERGIELVPNQNSFGHMERWLQHPAYHELAEAPEGFTDAWGVFRPDSTVLWPGNPDSLSFVQGLYDQLLPCFNSCQLNIGCDETYDLGKGRSLKEAEKRGLGEVYLDFLLKLADEAKGRGYKVQFWADILLNYPDLVSRIPKDLVAVNWGYEADWPFEKETGILAGAGRPFYVCTGTSSWNSLAGRWENALENIRNGAYWAEKNGAVGFMVTDWGDNGHWQQPVCSWPGFLMASQAAWGGAASLDSLGDEGWIFALDRLVLKNREASNILRTLASLYLENPVKLHNGSIFSYILSDPAYPYMRDKYKLCRDGGIGRAEAIIESCGMLLDKIPDASPFREELDATLMLCRTGLDFTKALFSTENCLPEELSDADTAILKTVLDKQILRFRSSWALSSRPGGLAESVGKMEAWMRRL